MRARRRSTTASSTKKLKSWRFRARASATALSILTKIRTLRHVRPAAEPELPDVAHAVAIIMDGNARWARKRGLPIAAGHRAGTKALRRTVEAAIDLGVDSLAVYAFSTENWSRPPDEVELLMVIFTETIERELPDLVRQGVLTLFICRRDLAPDALPQRNASLDADMERIHT